LYSFSFIDDDTKIIYDTRRYKVTDVVGNCFIMITSGKLGISDTFHCGVIRSSVCFDFHAFSFVSFIFWVAVGLLWSKLVYTAVQDIVEGEADGDGRNGLELVESVLASGSHK